MTSQLSREPYFLKFRSSEGFVILTVSVALFADVLLYTLILPIIPKAIVERAGVSPKDVQKWISILLAVYGVTVLITSPLFGYFSDRFKSRKGPFTVGLLALAISTCFFMFAHSPLTFVIARGLQGVSAAATMVVGFSLLVDTVSEDRIGGALGYVVMTMTVAPLVGPTIGGFTYEKLGFYGAFSVPIVLIVLDFIFRILIIEKSAATKWEKSHAKNPSEDNSPSSGTQNDLQASFTSDVPQQTDERSALLPRPGISGPAGKARGRNFIQILGIGRLQLALLATILVASVLGALEATLPLFVMERFHWSSSGAGLIFLPLTLPNILAVFIGQLADRFGTRIMGPVVCSLATVATISLRFTQDDNTKSHVVLSLLLVIVGFMFIVVDLGAMTEISTATGPTDDEEGSISQGYALYTMSFAGGQLIGPLVGGFVKAHAGWSVMTLVLGAMCGACAILTRFFGAQPSNSESMEGDDE